MKKIAYILIFSLTCILISPLNNETFAAEETPEASIIKEYEEDVTGDGIKETILLYGTLLSHDSAYYRDIYAVVETKSNQKWKIQYKGGYEPEIEFYDLTHNGINNMLFQSATGDSGGLYHYSLHTIEGNKVKEIDLPSQIVHGQFINDFQTKLIITPRTKPIILDLKDRAEEYIRLNIYNEKGQLLKNKSLMIDPITFFESILISKSKGYGLKSYQQINGAYHADLLGTVETIWYYENKKWIILQTEWKPANES